MGRVRRGVFKMQKTWFKPNNKRTPAKDTGCERPATSYVRPTHQQLQFATIKDERGDFHPTPMQMAQENSETVMLLRPKVAERTPVDKIQLKSVNTIAPTCGKPQPKSGADHYGGCYRFVDINSAVELGAQAVRDHQEKHPNCDGQPKLLAEAEERRGIAVSEMMSCVKCGYRTEQTKLYSEIPCESKRRGRRTATPNMSLQVGLQNTSIASAGARRLLTAMDTAVPSTSGLQKIANKCGEIIKTENLRDMAEKRHVVKDIHELQGFKRESPIAVEVDRQYNNPLRNCRKKTPFVPATQTRDTVCENVTSGKFIVMFNHESKLCKCRQRSQSVTSHQSTRSKHSSDCTATRRPDFNMGDEREGGVQCATKLVNCEEPLQVSRVTTDADGCLAQGINSVMRDKTGQDVESLLDPSHLNRSLCAAVSRAKFSEDMFPGNTVTERNKAQDRFADDISHRVQAEAEQISQKCGTDIVTIKKLAAKAVSAIPDCYMGDHRKCRKLSQVCKGKYNYPYLSHYVRRRLILSTKDKELLTRLLGTRMGDEALDKTKYRTSTQKSESMNHAFAMTNPKGTLTFSRNGAARDHSAIHLVNNQHANSILKKCKAAGCPISAGSPAASALAAIDRKQQYHKNRARGHHYKQRRAQCRAERYDSYYAKSNLYQSGQLNPKSGDIIEGLKIFKEHNYCRMFSKSTLKSTKKKRL